MARTLVLALALFSLGCEQQPAAGPPVAQAAPAQQGATETVATIGGEPITLAEVDDKAAAALMKARQEMFDARSQTLQALINERLVEAEAKAAGVETDDFLKQKIDDKIEPVLDADIDAFYAQNQARMRGPLDAMRDQIRGYLESQRKQSLMKELIDGLRAKADVKVMLSPPRIQVAAADSPRAGSADAPIQIIEFSDFQCPYCTRGAETLDQVKEKYGDKVSVVFRHFPLSFHTEAHKGAQASECANDQGKFWEYHDKLFANQKSMFDADLKRYAAELSLDQTAFDACLDSGKYKDKVDRDLEEGTAAGMSGTPGFFINGRFINGAQPLEVFVEIIDAELELQG